MATSATTLIQRVRRFVGDWPDLDSIAADITNTGALQFNMSVADSSIYGRGWLIQVDHEMMRIATIVNSGTITVTRAVQGTTAASHASGSTILVRPAWGDQQILDSLNAGVDATFPYYYQAVSDVSLTADGSTYEFAVPNMPNTSVPIPYLSKIEIKISGDPAYRLAPRWEVRRSSTPIIKFKSMAAPGSIRVHGFGPFTQLAFTDSLNALWPVWGDDVLIEYAANRLLLSGEAWRSRQDTGAKDDRQNANPPGGSMQLANQLLNRFQLRISSQPMPPMPKHVVPVI